MTLPASPTGGFILAVTGGLACGKSTVGLLLAGEGLEVLDTDEVAHDLLRSGTPQTAAVVTAFGPEMLAADGSVDRKVLAPRVFSDPAAMAQLNAIVHPAVRERVGEWTRSVRARNRAGAVQIPLLFEAGIDTLGWDAILVVAAEPDIVRSRLRQRGIDDEEALRRLAAQWPLEEKVRRATHVIWNNGSPEDLADNVRTTLGAMMNKETKNHD